MDAKEFHIAVLYILSIRGKQRLAERKACIEGLLAQPLYEDQRSLVLDMLIMVEKQIKHLQS